MTDAVIVSTARTPIARPIAARSTPPRVRPCSVPIGEGSRAQSRSQRGRDVVMGAPLQQGSTGGNIARKAFVARRLAGHRGRHHHRPAMRLGLQAIALARVR